MTDNQPCLRISSVTKRFGPLVACNNISLDVRAGEIMGLLGQNGAGKSTLMKIVIGVEKASNGEILIDGGRLNPGDPAAAAAAGIGMVHQHFSLVNRLTVWQNVFLGDRRRLDIRQSIEEVRSIGQRFGLEVDPLAIVENLSAGARQRVEIIKCLRSDPKVIILDEPTSVLTQTESIYLFEVLRSLVRDHGYAAILISHRLSEILQTTDRVTVLRSGQVVASLATSEVDARMLANMMLGRKVVLANEGTALVAGLEDDVLKPESAVVPTALQRSFHIESVVVRGEHGNALLDGFSLDVKGGEIVGLAGIEGNGQTALVEMLSRLKPLESGRIVLWDGGIEISSVPNDQIGIIPADRHDSGCVLEMTVAENLALNKLKDVSSRGLVRPSQLTANALRLIDEFDIAAADINAPMWTLSGGNQQKVIVARELSRKPAVIIAEQPTRGLDVGAMEYMWNRLRRAAAEGAAVLLVSTELDEILALAGRIVVIFRGQVSGEMNRTEIDLDRLGLMMGGISHAT